MVCNISSLLFKAFIFSPKKFTSSKRRSKWFSRLNSLHSWFIYTLCWSHNYREKHRLKHWI
jgi:hypothetical protein